MKKDIKECKYHPIDNDWICPDCRDRIYRQFVIKVVSYGIGVVIGIALVKAIIFIIITL